MSTLNDIIAEKEKYKELSFQCKKKISEMDQLNFQLEEQINAIQNETRTRLSQLKKNTNRLRATSADYEKSDEVMILEEELAVLVKQTNSYMEMYQKKKSNFEKGFNCAKTAFDSTLRDLQTVVKEIDYTVKRSRSAPIFSSSESLDSNNPLEIEEIDDVEIIEETTNTTQETNDKNGENQTEENQTEENQNEENQNEEKKLSLKRSTTTTRVPPHSLLMFATKYMTVKEPLKLAVGEAFIRSEQEYDGVGVIPLDCPWYICYFKGTNQAHFSSNGPDGQMLLSLTTINDSKAPPGKKGGVMAIFRSKQFETKKIIPFGLVGKNEKQLTSSTLKSVVPVVLQSIDPNIKQQFKPFKKEKLDADLKNYETSQGGIDYKFGLLYCGKGQVSEAEMYDNTDKDVSDDYREFLNLLGDIIPLKGHTGYRAGLDVNSDTTGTHGLYTMFYSSEIMFHTATLLPHVENDAQKTEKKRHIGNDFCVLIFKEGDELVDLSTFKSHFNSIFVIVKKIDPNIIVNHSSQYLIETWRSGDVPSFEPYLPVDGSYISKEFVREFLLSTLINGQISSYSSSEMRPKMVQARELCLRNILSK